jgi:hypothetical protein
MKQLSGFWKYRYLNGFFIERNHMMKPVTTIVVLLLLFISIAQLLRLIIRTQ